MALNNQLTDIYHAYQKKNKGKVAPWHNGDWPHYIKMAIQFNAMCVPEKRLSMVAWCRCTAWRSCHIMMTSWYNNALHLTGPLWGESICRRSIFSYVGLNKFVGFTVDLPVFETPCAHMLFVTEQGPHPNREKDIHHNVIAWKRLPHYWPFVRWIHRSLAAPPQKGSVTRSFDYAFEINVGQAVERLVISDFTTVMWRHCNDMLHFLSLAMTLVGIVKKRTYVTITMSWWPDVNTLRPRQMDAISQTTFSSAFSWMKMFEFRFEFHRSLFLRVQLTIFQHWFR